MGIRMEKHSYILVQSNINFNSNYILIYTQKYDAGYDDMCSFFLLCLCIRTEKRTFILFTYYVWTEPIFVYNFLKRIYQFMGLVCWKHLKKLFIFLYVNIIYEYNIYNVCMASITSFWLDYMKNFLENVQKISLLYITKI